MVSCSAIDCTKRSTDNPNIRFYQVRSEKKNKPLRKQRLQNVKPRWPAFKIQEFLYRF